MKDVAVECGVSIATVSKALNDHSDISEETRRKVKEAANRLGYYPNSAARALKTNRSYNIGVLLNNGLAHEYFAEVLESFKNEAEKKGYDITFVSNHSKKMTFYEHCLYRNFDGVLVACEDFSNPEIYEMVNGRLPVVTIDYIFNGSTSVNSNNVKGMSELVRYAYSRGHRKIAYIYGNVESEVTKERLAAFYKTMGELGVEVPDEYIKESTYLDSIKAEKLTYELLKLKEPPTCIFYPDDLSVVGGKNAIKNMKLHKNIEGIRMKARATGDFRSVNLNLDANLKKYGAKKKKSSTTTDTETTTPSGDTGKSESGSTTNPGSGSEGDGLE